MTEKIVSRIESYNLYQHKDLIEMYLKIEERINSLPSLLTDDIFKELHIQIPYHELVKLINNLKRKGGLKKGGSQGHV